LSPDSTVEVIASINVIIDAPAQLVWDVLMDLPRYGEWNPLAVRAESTLEIGAPVNMWLPDPANPGELWNIQEYIVLMEPPHHFAYQRPLAENGSRDGRRDQYITELGPERCSYFTVDLFTGAGMKEHVEKHGAWVKRSFDDMALALKTRAEQLHQES
jgi:Polyketide cyclase / dehydrase and lipid transport